MQCFALRLLSDFTLMYQHCVGVLLKRDTDLGAKEVSRHPMRVRMHAGNRRRLGRSAPFWLLLLAGCMVVIVAAAAACELMLCRWRRRINSSGLGGLPA